MISTKVWIACLVFYSVSSHAIAQGFSETGTPTYQLLEGQTVAPLQRFQECDHCPEMIALPMGEFTLGAPLEDSAEWEGWLFRNTRISRRKPGAPPGFAREGPVHQVGIDIPIAMGRNEVTHDEWMACVAEGGCNHVPSTIITVPDAIYDLRGRHPVRNISYFNILEYTTWLNVKVGADVYRLPTEAEWVFAARAGTDTSYIHGNEMPPGIANLGITRFDEDGNTIPKPPAPSRRPVRVDEMEDENAWGLRHMSGNLMELTMTCYSERHLGLATSSAYLAHARGQKSCQRVVKGSSYNSIQFLARVASRRWSSEHGRGGIIGFRVVRDLKP